MVTNLENNGMQEFGLVTKITVVLLLHRRHNGRDSVSNHQPHDCLLNRLYRHRSKKTSKLRVTDLCVGNSPGTGEFPVQMASNAENVSISWRHHDMIHTSVISTSIHVACLSLPTNHNIIFH